MLEQVGPRAHPAVHVVLAEQLAVELALDERTQDQWANDEDDLVHRPPERVRLGT
jgi:hypothetical protein